MNKKQRSFVHETTLFSKNAESTYFTWPPKHYPRPKAPELTQEDPERFFWGNQHPFLVTIKNGVLTYPLSQ